MATPGFCTGDPLDAPGVGRALFEVMEGERKRLAEWYAEVRGVLQAVAAGGDLFLAQRAKACLEHKPFLHQ
jgi:hypothetical protein